MQVAKHVTQDNKHSQAASFTQARTHACVLARQLQDSQADIKELMTEVAEWQKAASETAAQLQQRDAQVLLPPYAPQGIVCSCLVGSTRPAGRRSVHVDVAMILMQSFNHVTFVRMKQLF